MHIPNRDGSNAAHGGCALYDQYNTDLSALDGSFNEIQSDERKLDDYSGRMLAAVAAKYGKDSDEYEKAGGHAHQRAQTAHAQAEAIVGIVARQLPIGSLPEISSAGFLFSLSTVVRDGPSNP